MAGPTAADIAMRLLSQLVVLLMPLVSGGAQALTAVDGEQLEALYAVDQLVLDGAHECVLFKVYLADESRQKARGLMFVAELPNDWGMIFRYPSPRRIAMYMKNTLIPLDMLFFASDGSIIDIAHDTTPGSLTTIAAGAPAVAVLEINAGLSERLGLVKGKKLLSGTL